MPTKTQPNKSGKDSSMAFLLGPLLESTITTVVQGAASKGIDAASSAAKNAAADKQFREQWTPGQLDVIGPQHPGKNIVIVCTKHDASKLQGVEHSVLNCVCPASNSTVKYDCYACDSGDFVLQGDG